MKLLVLCSAAILVFFVQGDEYSDKGTNAAEVASAGIDACRNVNNKQPQKNSVPYLTSNSYMTNALKIVGGVLGFFHHRKMERQFKEAMDNLNRRFDWLEIDINTQFAELAAYIDRKQFQTDITDPTTILWGEMLAYAQWPNNETYANIFAGCVAQTPWKIATKLRNRLADSDNSLITQIQANQWSNSSFMAAKDVVISRLFQLMMVQSFCVGVKNGPDVSITEAWDMQRMYNIYSDVVNRTIASRIQQETDYFTQIVPDIVQTTVTSNDTKYFQSIADSIHDTLESRYQWDHFGVVVSENPCNAQIGDSSRPRISGYTPYSVQLIIVDKVKVFVIRYWTGQNAQYDRYNEYIRCYGQTWDGDMSKWASRINCGQQYAIVSNNWWCGKNVGFAPSRTRLPLSYYFVSHALYQNKDINYSSAVFPSPTRPTTVAYDLGFWERPIPIHLMPASG